MSKIRFDAGPNVNDTRKMLQSGLEELFEPSFLQNVTRRQLGARTAPSESCVLSQFPSFLLDFEGIQTNELLR
jgi:hypothetical protein